MKIALVSLIMLMALSHQVTVFADGSEKDNRGFEIAKKSQDISFGYKTLNAQASMDLYHGNKISSTRSFSLTASETVEKKEFDKARIDVRKPKSLEGVILLSWSSFEGREQQWIHTPRIKQTRRIGDNSRKARFINSDFAYEDLLRWQLVNYEYQYIKTEPCNDGECQIVNAVPLKKYSNYSVLEIWYDSLFRVVRVDYKDKHGRLNKRLLQKQYKYYSNKYWQPTVSEMTDFRGKTKTIIHWSDFKFDQNYKKTMFDSSQLGAS